MSNVRMSTKLMRMRDESCGRKVVKPSQRYRVPKYPSAMSSPLRKRLEDESESYYRCFRVDLSFFCYRRRCFDRLRAVLAVYVANQKASMCGAPVEPVNKRGPARSRLPPGPVNDIMTAHQLNACARDHLHQDDRADFRRRSRHRLDSCGLLSRYEVQYYSDEAGLFQAGLLSLSHRLSSRHVSQALCSTTST